MPFEEYWIGKGLDLETLWQDFESGSGYIQKFKETKPHLLRLTFTDHPKNLPLFDHEVLYKTIKGTFHDVKAECLTREAYESAAPIFLYRVERGSGIFEFLAQLDPLLTYVTALGAAMMYYRNSLAKDQELDERKWNFIRSQFSSASDQDIMAYMKAWTTWGKRRVLHRLIENGLYRVEISKCSFNGEQPPGATEMVNVSKLLEDTSKESDS